MVRTKYDSEKDNVRMVRTNPSKPIRKPQPKKYKTPGRLGTYDENCAERAYKLCSAKGLTNTELGLAFGISHGTIDNWKRDHEEFRNAIHAGKAFFDSGVELTLLRRATGYEYEETSTTKRKTKDGEVITNITTTNKHVLPDTTALIFWLKNRKKAEWADVNRTEITSNINLNIPRPDQIAHLLTDEEKKFVKNIAIKQMSGVRGISQN